MADDESFDNPDAHEQLPSVHVDYRVFAVDVYGGPDDDLEDVADVAEHRIEEALDHIKRLKRNDYELADEYDPDAEGRGPSGQYQ